jgi:glucose/arabinose dehydrogenase
MAWRAGRGRFWAALVAAAAIAIGCTTTTPSASPAVTATSPASTPASPGAPIPSLTSNPTDAPFVAANVRVTLQPLATVPGGALAIAAPDDGSGRLFVATQQGRVWAVTNGVTADHSMLDISGRITSGGERGLLGIALHPGFPTDPRIFTDYTDRNGNTVVSSFRLVSGDASRFDPTSEAIVLRVDQPFANHNGGGVIFGPDGNLYITLGDGGGGGDPRGNGQNLNVLLAKILRIDVDHPAGDRAYGIPVDNPLFGQRGGSQRAEIWLWGLRNPWRVSFDRATEDFWIGDVGQNKWEEIDVVRAGTSFQNFGWNRMEGAHCYAPASGCDKSGLTLPVTEYGHDQGCAVIGGYVYRGTGYPILRRAYLFSDSCSGTIWAIPAAATQPVQPVAVGETSGSPAGFGEDPAGELYLANLDGTISRLAASSR